jgi:hypothetical protein
MNPYLLPLPVCSGNGVGASAVFTIFGGTEGSEPPGRMWCF